MSNHPSLWPFPRMIVHRAGGFLAPENTRAAFEVAVNLKCDAIETDVMMTSDGELILSHDEELGRAVDGVGLVAEMTKAELLKLDAGIRFGSQWQGQRMMTFEESLLFCHAHDLFMNIEIKPAQGFAKETAQAVARTLAAFAAAGKVRGDRVLISSFSVQALSAFRAVDANTTCGLLLEDVPENWLSVAHELGVKTVHSDYTIVTPEFVAVAHDAGLGIMAYTVDDVEQAQTLLAMGVDAICTNRPDVLAPVLVA